MVAGLRWQTNGNSLTPFQSASADSSTSFHFPPLNHAPIWVLRDLLTGLPPQILGRRDADTVSEISPVGIDTCISRPSAVVRPLAPSRSESHELFSIFRTETLAGDL